MFTNTPVMTLFCASGLLVSLVQRLYPAHTWLIQVWLVSPGGVKTDLITLHGTDP